MTRGRAREGVALMVSVTMRQRLCGGMESCNPLINIKAISMSVVDQMYGGVLIKKIREGIEGGICEEQ